MLPTWMSTSIESILIKAQLRWVGHVIRMEEHRMPKCLMYGGLWQGRRYQGRPKLRYKDTVKSNIQWCHVKLKELEESAANKPEWRAKTYKSAATFESARKQKVAAARARRHHAATAVITTTDFTCPHCSRLCASSFGLISHLRAYK